MIHQLILLNGVWTGLNKLKNTASVVEMAKELREVFKETPVLATFRSKKEGGELEVSTEYYVELNCAVAKSGYVDAVDVELYTGDKEVETIVTTAHEKWSKSNHVEPRLL